MTLPSVVGQAWAGGLGLVVGSFLAVCIRRLPEDRSLLVPSACPHCGHRVRWRDNVPVLSWLLLRGRCRDCGRPISAFYPMVEALTGLVAWLLYRRVFPEGAPLDAAHGVAFTSRFVFLCLLVVSAYVDLRHRIIPDETSIYAVPVGIAFAAAGQWAGLGGFGTPTVAGSVLGALAWGGSFAAISLLGTWILRTEILGWGDAKLVAMFGAFLGVFPGALLAVLGGSLVGSVAGLVILAVARRRVHLAFGPPLAVGGAAYALWGDALFRNLFG